MNLLQHFFLSLEHIKKHRIPNCTKNHRLDIDKTKAVFVLFIKEKALKCQTSTAVYLRLLRRKFLIFFFKFLKYLYEPNAGGLEQHSVFWYFVTAIISCLCNCNR